VTLTQANYHRSYMEAMGESRDFEDILSGNADEARAVAEQLYTHQEASLKQGALDHFTWMRAGGRLD
jgi:hypothetical protein